MPEQRLYRIMVPPRGELQLRLSFEPKTEREVHFELPLKLAGVESTDPTCIKLRRAVLGEGLRPRLLLSQTTLKMGERIVRHPPPISPPYLPYISPTSPYISPTSPLHLPRQVRDAKFPYTHELTLTSADDAPLEWELDVAAEAAATPFTLTPTRGTLAVGEAITVAIAFAPSEAALYAVAVPG